MITPCNSIAHLEDVVSPFTKVILKAFSFDLSEIVIQDSQVPGKWFFWKESPVKTLLNRLEGIVSSERYRGFYDSAYVTDLEAACKELATLEKEGSTYLKGAFNNLGIPLDSILLNLNEMGELVIAENDDIDRIEEVFHRIVSEAEREVMNDWGGLLHEFINSGELNHLEIFVLTWLNEGGEDRLNTVSAEDCEDQYHIDQWQNNRDNAVA